MTSSTLAIPPSYDKPTPSIRKSKLDTAQVRSEDELLKFFLHGSYDVQRGNMHTSPAEENNDKTVCIKDEQATISSLNTDDKKGKSRCMFEETYMINISVKQPDAKPSSKQIDVRIEKTPADTNNSNENVEDDDDDEISSIFDEEENDEVDSVVFNEINSSTSETPSTKLTLADMINKTLTTIPNSSSDKLNQVNNNWYIDKQGEIKTRKPNEGISSPMAEKVIKTPTPPPPPPVPIPTATLTTNIQEDEKLFEYLDYLETKEETNQSIKPSNIPTSTKKTPKPPLQPINKTPSKHNQEPIPIIDLEQLCRSLNVSDLRNELIQKKIYELKILIDERHKKQKSQIPLIKPRKDNLPILIAMPPVHQQRRRTTINQPTTLLQSKTVNFQVPYNSTYHDIISTYNNKHFPLSNQQYTQRHHIPSTTTRKYQYT